MSKQLILIDTNLSKAQFESVCPMEGDRYTRTQSVSDYLMSLSGGNQSADTKIQVGAVGASATLTSSGAGSANGQIGTILNVEIKAVTSGANPLVGEFNISGTPATQAASMEAAIRAVLGSKLDVVRQGAVVTVTSKVPGSLTNGLQISAGNLANVAVGAFSGGSDGTEHELSSGKK